MGDVSRFSPPFKLISPVEALAPIFGDLDAGISGFDSRICIVIYDGKQVKQNSKTLNHKPYTLHPKHQSTLNPKPSILTETLYFQPSTLSSKP